MSKENIFAKDSVEEAGVEELAAPDVDEAKEAAEAAVEEREVIQWGNRGV